MSEELTEEQAEAMLRDYAKKQESVQGFFSDIIVADDTTKTGYLSEEELGEVSLPLRSSKELELFCNDVWSETEWGKYFKKLGEITTSTSLSKDGILIKSVGTKRSEVADVTPKVKKENKGWFKKKQ